MLTMHDGCVTGRFIRMNMNVIDEENGARREQSSYFTTIIIRQ